jgi:hypothetical protein
MGDSHNITDHNSPLGCILPGLEEICGGCLLWQSGCVCSATMDINFGATETYSAEHAPYDDNPVRLYPFDLYALDTPVDSQGSAQLGTTKLAKEQFKHSKPKFSRTRINKSNKKILEDQFWKDAYLKDDALARLEADTQLPPRVIQTWFLNARARKSRSESEY